MPRRSFAERYARDRATRACRAKVFGMGFIVALMVGWGIFAIIAIRALQPARIEDEAMLQKREVIAQRRKTWENEDFETDIRTGLRLPKFWKPLEEQSQKLHEIWDTVEDQPTIFLMIASYRDFQCRETVASAFSRAQYPKRIQVNVVEQSVEGEDIGCDEPIEGSCDSNPGQPLCQYKSQLHIYKMKASDATGPVYARHIGSRLYRGEAFAMQIDAHVTFIQDWDESLLSQWYATNNEMAILSTYLTDVQNSIDSNGNSLRKTRPIMCNSAFEGRPPARYLRHGAQPEEEPAVKGTPMLHPYWAAGFSFGRGHFAYKVPYDCCLPFVFMGEEISIGIRAWTHGYDLYAVESSVVFHEYAKLSKRRRKVHMFWEQKQSSSDQGHESLKRLTAIIKMAPDITDYNRVDEDKYGLGNVRDVNLFYKLFLIDTVRRTSTQLCKFVKTGVMHRAFSPYIQTKQYQGVDYSQLTDFDTGKAIQEELDVHWRPQARHAIKRALEMNQIGWLRNAIDVANRAELKATDPELLQQAHDALLELQRQDRGQHAK